MADLRGPCGISETANFPICPKRVFDFLNECFLGIILEPSRFGVSRHCRFILSGAAFQGRVPLWLCTTVGAVYDRASLLDLTMRAVIDLLCPKQRLKQTVTK